MSYQIGENISVLRKKCGITQEQLGEMLGVSGQAVSKWENGGVPDTFLLPQIAKILGVSTDALFGTEKDISEISEKEVLRLLFDFCLYRSGNKPDGFDRFGFLFEVLWNIQCAYLGIDDFPDLSEAIEKHARNPQITSQIINNEGTTYLSLVKGFPFYCAVRDDPEISKKILREEGFSEFFGLFSDADALKAVFFTQCADEAGQFTEKAISEKIGISLGKFREIAPCLVKYGLLHEDGLLLDDQIVRIYHKWSNPEIRPLLMMAYQFIHARQCYYNFTCNRTKPYFEK